MTKRLLPILVLAVTTSVCTIAQTKPVPKISMEKAKATALKKENGTIKSSELEKEHGRWIYSFDVATADGIHEVNIDANTGKVVEDSKETASEEAKEATMDHKKAAKTQSPK